MRGLTRAAVAAAAALTAGAPRAATWTIELRGEAPVVCKADLAQSQVTGSGGQTSLGALNELCNDARGFHVFARTSPGAGGVFIVDGRSVPLSTDGQTEIDVSPSAAIATRQLAYDPQGGPPLQSLTISVVAN